MIRWLLPTFIVAAFDWLAVCRGRKYLEYAAKPGTMILLLAALIFLGSNKTPLLVCFEAGVFLCLLGDIFLIVSYARFSDRWFLAGLAAFLLAHVAYILGLNSPLPRVSPLPSVAVSIVLALTAGTVLGRIVRGIRAKKVRRLEAPVITYGVVITFMVLSAILTLLNEGWGFPASLLVAVGALLFYASDVILATNKFLNPINNGRLVNIILYHLGQITLAAGVLLQSGIK